jgi:DtxR family Mn-dependent transcriptional regulator
MTATPVNEGGRAWGADCPVQRPVPDHDQCAGRGCDSVALTDLAETTRGRITCLDEADDGALRKLVAMGVLPGTEIVLLQRSPVFVFRLGYAEFAVDRGLAQRVRVRVEPATHS